MAKKIRYKIIKDKEDEFYIQAKRTGEYPFSIHKRFFTRASAENYIKQLKNRKK